MGTSPYSTLIIALMNHRIVRNVFIINGKVRDGRIIHRTEFWPDPYEPPPWRVPWMEATEGN